MVVKQEPLSEDEQDSRDIKDALKHNLKASTSVGGDHDVEATEGLSKTAKKRLRKQKRHQEKLERAQLLNKDDSDDSSTARSSPTKSKLGA